MLILLFAVVLPSDSDLYCGCYLLRMVCEFATLAIFCFCKFACPFVFQWLRGSCMQKMKRVLFSVQSKSCEHVFVWEEDMRMGVG
jgi:hypothetical protein